MFVHFTPRTFARAPFRVAISAATVVAILGAGGFTALPKPRAPAPVIASIQAPAPTAPAPTASVTLAASAVPIVVASTSLASVRPAELTCLAKAVYYEARGESAEGQAAVAQVVLNRTRRANYPSNVCGVVFQGVNRGGCQFSFVCNGAMHRPIEPAAWSRARRVAADVMGGHVMRAVGQAVSFHAASLGAGGFGQIARIGGHVFFLPGRASGVLASRPARALRFAGESHDAPSPAMAAAVASAARDASATAPAMAPVVVAANSQTAPSAGAQ